MLVKTKFFGEVDLPEEKIITFERGLIGLAVIKNSRFYMTVKKRTAIFLGYRVLRSQLWHCRL